MVSARSGRRVRYAAPVPALFRAVPAHPAIRTHGALPQGQPSGQPRHQTQGLPRTRSRGGASRLRIVVTPLGKGAPMSATTETSAGAAAVQPFTIPVASEAELAALRARITATR